MCPCRDPSQLSRQVKVTKQNTICYATVIRSSGSARQMTTHLSGCFTRPLPQQRVHAAPRVNRQLLKSQCANHTHIRCLGCFQPASCSSAPQQLQHDTPDPDSIRSRHAMGEESKIKCLPPTVNWHLEPRCNYGCKFCFATFKDVKQHLEAKLEQGPISEMDLLLVPQLLKDAGADKVNFVGGEPFLHPLIFPLIEAAKAAGLVTSVVTNGSCLTASKLLRLKGRLDWLAFSVDASNDDLHAAMGRGLPPELKPSKAAGAAAGTAVADGSGAAAAAAAAGSRPVGHFSRVLPLWSMAQELGFKLKLNTVVTRINLHDDMAPLVLRLSPERWKVFQVLPMEGQNDGRVEPLLIQQQEFDTWVARHRPAVEAAGIPLVLESNDDMRGSYAMLDADCRFYTNASGRHEYGPSIFDVPGGVEEAWAAVAGPAFSAATFLQRGGLYDWGQGQEDMRATLLQLSGMDESRR